MNEKNIESLKVQLTSLGLHPDVEYQLRANICLEPHNFQVPYRQIKEADTMNSIFYIEQNENGYYCRYYEACLRKKISVPLILLNEVDLNDLHERMNVVDWDIRPSDISKDKIQKEKVVAWEREEAIAGIVADLKKLSETAEGLQLADRLRLKFWADTPLVSLIPNLNVLRNHYEISQRFYFFDGEEQITLDEAYRFLSHRWRERQLNAKKKEPENNDGRESGNASGSIQVANKNKLLVKKRTAKRKVM
jgi:hypothetical protein